MGDFAEAGALGGAVAIIMVEEEGGEFLGEDGDAGGIGGALDVDAGFVVAEFHGGEDADFVEGVGIEVGVGDVELPEGSPWPVR